MSEKPLDHIRVNAALYRIESGMDLLDDDAEILARGYRWMENEHASLQAELQVYREAATVEANEVLRPLMDKNASLQAEMGRLLADIDRYDKSTFELAARADTLQAEVKTYQTAFDWSGLKSWAETIVEEWKSSSGIERNRMYASMKVAEKLLVGIALLSKE